LLTPARRDDVARRSFRSGLLVSLPPAPAPHAAFCSFSSATSRVSAAISSNVALRRRDAISAAAAFDPEWRRIFAISISIADATPPSPPERICCSLASTAGAFSYPILSTNAMNSVLRTRAVVEAW
jgi:hypothetical protein